LDICGGDVLATREDHVLLAIDDVEKDLGVEPPEVSRTYPLAARRVDPGCLPVRLVQAMVAGHHKPCVADDFADLARRDLAVVIADDPDVGAEYRLADRLELALEVLGLKNRDQPLGEPVE